MCTDIVLINPPYLYITKSPIRSGLGATLDMPPLGLYYIGTILEKSGYKVKIYDFNAIDDDNFDETINEIVALSPKIIGFSISTPCYNIGIEITNKIRQYAKQDLKVIYGGYHVSFLPNEPLLKNYCDYIVRGEGEYAFLKLSNYILGKGTQELKSIEGISYLDKHKNVVHNKPEIVRIDNLDLLPYPKRNFIDPSVYNVPGTIMASRGCIAKCQFCAAGAWGGIRLRSVDNIIGEIEEMVDTYKFEHICFIDNTFILNKDTVESMAKKISALNLDVSFSLETRAGLLTNDLVHYLKQMNAISIQFGVETGNDYIMKAINKDITIKDVFKSVELCLQNDLNVMCSFIIGHPEDTKETVKDTIAVAKKLRRLGAQVKFEILTPYPGTEIFNNMNNLGIKLITNNYDEWNGVSAVYNSKNLTHKEIDNLLLVALTEVNAI